MFGIKFSLFKFNMQLHLLNIHARSYEETGGQNVKKHNILTQANTI